MPDMPEIMSKTAIFVRLEDVLNDPQRRQELYNRLIDPNRYPKLEEIGDGIYSLLYRNLLSTSQKTHMRNDWFANWWPDVQAKGPNGRGGVEQSVRLGLIRLIERVGLRCCPYIDCYWACAYQHDHNCAHPKGEDSNPRDIAMMMDPDGGVIERMTDNERKFYEQFSQMPGDQQRDAAQLIRDWTGLNTCPADRDVICTISWSPVQVTFIVHTPPPDVPGDPYPPIPDDRAVPEPIQVVKHVNMGTEERPIWDIDGDIIADRYGY
jgi:hypothetical protein